MKNKVIMRMNKQKVGSVKKITCLTCDGSKTNPDNISEKCPDCNGTGFIQGTTVNQ